jgi:hypothetical protein
MKQAIVLVNVEIGGYNGTDLIATDDGLPYIEKYDGETGALQWKRLV